ncbi:MULTISPECIES: hypothetical protein [unclassified Streptomyces]|uniref:hypothetical protein n=1 Tax=unclassified Streptomyces TaxID=2593676 RepID=UPI00324DE2B3
MRLLKAKRLLAAASVVAAAGVVPLVMATPASANQSTCVNYIGDHGYIVGPKVRAACSHGHTGPAPSTLCVTGLINAGVHDDDALPACRVA